MSMHLLTRMFAVVAMMVAVYVPHGAFASPADSSVWVEVVRDDGAVFRGYRLPREGEGMGAVIAVNEIATAAHVVWRARSIMVTTGDGSHVPAKIIHIDDDVDAAILRVERPLGRPTTIRRSLPVAGEKVSAVERLRQGGVPIVTFGAVGAGRWTTNGVAVPTVLSLIKGEKGMSGGGLFDAEGKLLGIIIRIDGTLGYLSALPIAEFCARFSRCGTAAR
jgi:S1-C subfamily serine protease